LTSGKIPKLFKRGKAIKITKPGKDGSDPSNFRPIALLSIVFKILERMILQQIQPLIDAVVPMYCTEQVLVLTSHIEACFQRKLKTGVVFIDLTAAYNTVWKDGVMLKFIRIVPCVLLSKLLNNMLSNRFFQVFLGNKSSRCRRLNNGLPQGSVLAPLLFSLYLTDIRTALSNQFKYADDIALTYQHESFSDCEPNLELILNV
jgi:hypothetical protein